MIKTSPITGLRLWVEEACLLDEVAVVRGQFKGCAGHVYRVDDSPYGVDPEWQLPMLWLWLSDGRRVCVAGHEVAILTRAAMMPIIDGNGNLDWTDYRRKPLKPTPFAEAITLVLFVAIMLAIVGGSWFNL